MCYLNDFINKSNAPLKLYENIFHRDSSYAKFVSLRERVFKKSLGKNKETNQKAKSVFVLSFTFIIKNQKTYPWGWLGVAPISRRVDSSWVPDTHGWSRVYSRSWPHGGSLIGVHGMHWVGSRGHSVDCGFVPVPALCLLQSTIRPP